MRWSLGLALLMLIPTSQANSQDFNNTDGRIQRAITLFLPNPISNDEFAVYSNCLSLSPMQKKYLEDHIEAYHTRMAAMYTQDVLPLWELSSFAVQIRREYGVRSQEYLEATSDLFRKRAALVDWVASADKRLLDLVLLLLGESQLPQFERVRSMRSRVRSNVFRPLVPASNLDLAFLLHEFEDWRQHSIALSPLLEEYEAQLTSLMARRCRASERQMTQAAQLINQEGYAEYERVTRAVANAAYAIWELNEEYVMRFAEQLPTAVGQSLIDRVRNEAYPELFPDPAFVGHLATRALDLASITAEQRDGIHIIVETYRAEYERLCQQAIRAHVAKRRAVAATIRASTRGSLEGRDDVETLAQQRDELNERLELDLAAILSDSQLEVVYQEGDQR